MIAAIVVAAVAALPALNAILWSSPKYSFEKLTGHSLPSGIRTVQYESALCDNLIRSCYYWKLEHGPEAFWPLVGKGCSTNFDALDGFRAEVLGVLDPKLSAREVTRAFRWAGAHGRSHFLFAHTNSTNSYFYVGTL